MDLGGGVAQAAEPDVVVGAQPVRGAVDVEHRHRDRRRLLGLQRAQPRAAGGALHHQPRPFGAVLDPPVVQVPEQRRRCGAVEERLVGGVVEDQDVHVAVRPCSPGQLLSGLRDGRGTRRDGLVRGEGRVAGLSFLGAGDPTFTPDKSSGGEDAEAVEELAEQLAATAEAEPDGVDVLVFHDPAPAGVFDGVVPTALFGHWHYRKVTHGDEGTWLMVQGTTGGSGLRALEPEEPAAISLSVLYLDRETGSLVAYDDIRVGGLGLASAQINRHVVDVPSDTTELVSPEH